MTRRPVIGITCARETVRHGAWEHVVQFVPEDYLAAVHAAGARASLLPVDDLPEDHPDEVLDGLDGLMVTGGADLAPGTYGAERHPATGGDDRARDRFEVALVNATVERDLPLLAVCRGMQVANAAGGGTVVQHLPETLGTDAHRRVPGTLDERNAHPVHLAPGSLAARVCGTDSVSVRSHHHQGVGRIASGWRVSGWATPDEHPEAMERPDRRFCLAVQWHPEGDPASPVIAALVAATRATVA